MTTIIGVGPSVSSQFDELKTAKRFPIIELKSVYGLSNLRDIVEITGAGTVTNTTVEYQLSTTADGLDSATLDSAERGRYMPGFAGQSGLGVRIPAAPTGDQVFRWGMFDDENGAFFGNSVSDGIFVAVRRDGVDTIIPQIGWNVDPLDGTGPSGFNLNLALGNIFQVTFTWYGYGVIEFNVVIQNTATFAQEVVTAHRFRPANETSFADPNLPIRAQIDNNGTAATSDLFVGGRQYSIIGKYNPEFRITSERRNATATTTGVPVISFQRKAVFPPGSARANSVSVNLEGVDIVTSDDVFFQIIVGGTLDTPYVNFPTATTEIPDNETALLVNATATTITGGEVVFQGVVSGAAGVANRDLGVADLLDFELPDDQSVSLVIGTFTGTTAVSAVFRVTEEW
ncbi:hypothetical protein EDC19_0936 [Natranaerovirga hydrolytica]|uniref:Uncharacterized protein n=1 Tax=Natranaerovirga hydrolytica TaxID=680378 RepID=A0A4R1N3A1_9FIRM|nr:hypothetical protein [Natranaerovirga hydrolytica]TCK98514.1 hypothetical protein EDC19_0936 [Natranaerovirga hydrolytica]